MTELSGSIEQKKVTPPVVEKPALVEVKEVKAEAPKPKPVEVPKPVKADLQYRLNIFNTAGNMKPSVSVPLYQDMCRRNGEVIRALSSTKWMTIDEILKAVWQIETKMRHPSNRTRPSIENAMKELIEREMVSVR